jgi:hypothetical protein
MAHIEDIMYKIRKGRKHRRKLMHTPQQSDEGERRMLMLKINPDTFVTIGDDIRIFNNQGSTIAVGISAPPDVPIERVPIDALPDAPAEYYEQESETCRPQDDDLARVQLNEGRDK